jgi:predicted HNH restriction endonuclease
MEVVNGDTTFVMSLRLVRISDRRIFKDSSEWLQYYKYKIAARKVYPYAVQAINLYNDIRLETMDMGRWKRKRYIRKEHKELKDDFTDKLKGLSRTQGKVLIKMIERQVGKSFFDIVKETRGGAVANYWNTLGKMYNYDLKDAYRVGSDPLLDEVLMDYDFGEAVWRY